MTSEFFSRKKVFTDNLFAGAVAIMDKSFMPDMERLSVLGIGVAVRVRTSIFVLNSLITSFCF